jgi:AbrB family looped-hinge helix DNA binding protein
MKRGAVMESIRFKKKSQMTIPKDIVDALGLHEGDQLSCHLEAGKLYLYRWSQFRVINRGSGQRNGKGGTGSQIGIKI